MLAVCNVSWFHADSPFATSLPTTLPASHLHFAHPRPAVYKVEISRHPTCDCPDHAKASAVVHDCFWISAVGGRLASLPSASPCCACLPARRPVPPACLHDCLPAHLPQALVPCSFPRALRTQCMHYSSCRRWQVHLKRCARLSPCGIQGNLCKHILFVYLRALKVAPNKPLVWQKALLTQEVRLFGGLAACLAHTLALTSIQAHTWVHTCKPTLGFTHANTHSNMRNRWFLNAVRHANAHSQNTRARA